MFLNEFIKQGVGFDVFSKVPSYSNFLLTEIYWTYPNHRFFQKKWFKIKYKDQGVFLRILDQGHIACPTFSAKLMLLEIGYEMWRERRIDLQIS